MRCCWLAVFGVNDLNGFELSAFNGLFFVSLLGYILFIC